MAAEREDDSAMLSYVLFFLRNEKKNALRGAHSAQYRNIRSPENIFHYGFPQARGVVIELKTVRLRIEMEFPQAISVREPAQRAELLPLEWTLEFVGDAHESHTLNYNTRHHLPS